MVRLRYLCSLKTNEAISDFLKELGTDKVKTKITRNVQIRFLRFWTRLVVSIFI
jgi:hypothetical protein